MLKPFPSLHEPDERFQCLGFDDPAIGHVRPLCAADLHNEVQQIALSPSLPAEVREQFDLARNAYLYSWFVYEFVVLAEQHSYIVLEMALSHRAKSEGLGNLTMRRGLQRAVKRGWLRKEDFAIPGGPKARPMSYLEELPNLRNRLLHGRMHLSADFALMMLRKCAELLNKLYPAPPA